MASINSFLKKIAAETGAMSFAESKYGEVANWISTGSYALNRIISGSIHKGIPSGRVIILGGESATGKSKIAATIAANAINSNGYDAVFYFDSEGGGLKDFFENCGCDTSKVFQILVSSVEDAQLQILKVYSQIEDHKKDEPESKFLCILDSLGALVTEKLIKDANNDKVAGDMGLRAKSINNMLKAITVPALKSDTAMIILNHVYQNPNAMFSSKIQQQGGGLGVQYMGSVNIQCTRNLEKDQSADKDSFYAGTNLTFFTVKNRFCRPSLEAKIYLDFKKGFVNKYDGLFDEAVKYGFITNPKVGYFCVPSWSDPEKLWRRTQLEANEEVWSTFIDDFDKRSIEDLKYSSAGESMDAGAEQAII